MVTEYLETKENGLRKAFVGATAPGVAIHELAHVLILLAFNLRIKEVTFFQFDIPIGYVTHAQPRRAFTAFLVAIAPLMVNLSVAVGAFWGGTRLAGHVTLTGASLMDSLAGLAAVIGLYQLGLAASVHAIPSRQDVHNAVDVFKGQWWNPLIIILFPLLVGVYVLTLTDRYRAHLLLIPITGGCGIWIAIATPTLSDVGWIVDLLI